MGTTAEVLKAGVPSIPIPHVVDQFAWAKRIYSMGTASNPIPRKKLTAGLLAKAILGILQNEGIKTKAGEIALCINGENGLEKAIQEIATIGK